MNTIEAIYNRRAIKHFDAEHQMSAEEEIVVENHF